MPHGIAPMLAITGDMPADAAAWAFEYKWDGVRALAYIDRSSFRLESRNLLDITPRYPELSGLPDVLSDHQAVLDGEIVALDEADRPSFALLQERMHVKDPAAIRRLMEAIPVYYFVFDLLWLDGQSLMHQPFAARREALQRLMLAGPHWRVSPHYVGQGPQMLRAAEQNHLEGIIAKRLDSPYQPGRRSPEWIKLKIVQEEEFIIGGWTGEKNSADGLGSILVGYYDASCSGRRTSRLRYAGRVGTGFDARTRHRLLAQLKPLARSTSPFVDALPPPSRFARSSATIHFAEPKLVAQIAYCRWPDGGAIQHASFLGLRDDKAAREVVRC